MTSFGIDPDPMPQWQLERVGMKEISRLQLAWAARFGDESPLGRLYANEAEKRLVDLFNKDNGGAK